MEKMGAGILVHPSLVNLEQRMLPNFGITRQAFWDGLANAVRKLGPRNRELLAERETLQRKIDEWLIAWRATHTTFDKGEFHRFLQGIGYIVPEGDLFQVSTANVDPEIAIINGPQLVAPIGNARLITSAAQRWASLFDALAGSDVISEDDGAERGGNYNPRRGAKVIDYVDQKVLDQYYPLTGGRSHANVSAYGVQLDDGKARLFAEFGFGEEIQKLQNPGQFVGFNRGAEEVLTSILLRKNGIHLELRIDRTNLIGKQHHAGVSDVLAESVLTFIADLEDANSAVNGAEKAASYQNMWELLTGKLTASAKSGKPRGIPADRNCLAPDGAEMVIPGRSLYMFRNVGIHLFTSAVTVDGEPIPESFLDCWFTVLASLYDILGDGQFKNSKTGKIYIVAPKFQGPDEVASKVALFELAEEIFGLKKNTILIGIMDEEERTSCNLVECIRVARDRVFFINTGFLDRTASKIHFGMHAGPMMPKADIKTAPWMLAYENGNVDVGIATGLHLVGEVGKGMWAMTDLMRQMMETKIGHLKAGGNCAWCPSPTAAALHSLHYLEVDVDQVQRDLAGRQRASIEDIISLPLLTRKLSFEEIENEVRNNIQGILGYIARWVGLGIGCSKVMDINYVQLMEDLATLRISSQHIANWVLHGLITRERVEGIFGEMAVIVDRQNTETANYEPMAPALKHESFTTALKLVQNGVTEPSGLTEVPLRDGRLAVIDRLAKAV